MKEKKKLLIADDNESIHDILRRVFSSDEYDIVHAYDGEEALKLAEEQQPNLILLDVLMPRVDGRDVCRKLRNNPKTRDIKIIMMTAKGAQHDRILGLQLGADDYIPKPFSVHYLYRTAARLLDKE